MDFLLTAAHSNVNTRCDGSTQQYQNFYALLNIICRPGLHGALWQTKNKGLRKIPKAFFGGCVIAAKAVLMTAHDDCAVGGG